MTNAVITALMLVSITGCVSKQEDSQSGQSTQQDDVVVYGRITGTEPLRVLDYEYESGRQMLANKQNDAGRPVGVGTVVRVDSRLREQDQTYAVKKLQPVYAVLGIIEQVDSERVSYVISGQPVLVDEQTVFGNSGDETLEVGNVVLVSGFYNNSGGITASRMDLLDLVYTVGISEIMVSGRVHDKKPSSGTFAIGELVVEYGSEWRDELVKLQDGVIRVTGILRPDNGHLILQAMESAIDLENVSEGQHIVMEGVVSSLAARVLGINQVPVKTEADTDADISIQKELTTGSHVIMDGFMDAAGAIVANGVLLLKSAAAPSARVKLVATLDEVREDGFSLLGQSVQVDEQTLYVDHSLEKLQTLGLADLTAGDRVKVLAWREGEILHATLVERKVPDEAASVELKGLATGNSVAGLQVAEVPVLIVQDQTRLLDAQENFISIEELDAYLSGSEPVLEVKGQWDGATVTSQTIQLD